MDAKTLLAVCILLGGVVLFAAVDDPVEARRPATSNGGMRSKTPDAPEIKQVRRHNEDPSDTEVVTIESGSRTNVTHFDIEFTPLQDGDTVRLFRAGRLRLKF